jgi:DUF1680 family protein
MRRREFLQGGLAVAGAAAVGLGTGPGALAKDLTADAAKPLEEFGYGDVTLAPGLMQTQFEQTQAVLLGLDEEALLRPYRLRAGLPAPGGPLGGWYDEVPLIKTPSGGDGFAPGHAFGQWISAMSRGYAVNRDPATQAKVRRLLEAYEPAISGKFFSNFRFPAYDYDKIVIGMIDAHQFAAAPNAFALLDKVTDAAEPNLPPTALDRDGPQIAWRKATGQSTTNDYGWDEPYTLPENLYLAAARGAGERYRKLALRFLLDATYFDPLAEGKNVLPNHHAYSFCNALNSAMQAYLSGGSEKHLRAATNAHEMIVTTQSYATGGWGPDEAFREPGTGALYASLENTHHSFETPCGSYGHFKLTRYLLRVTKDGQYGDSMERVLYNTVLGAKPLQANGKAFYYSDYNNSASKFYFDDPWPCCSGTLPQVAADYHILGYFHDSEGVYVNLYLPSTLKWTHPHGAHVELTQSGGYPLEGRVQLVVKTAKSVDFTLRLRIPAWAKDADGAGPAILVNGQVAQAPVSKGFATLRRKWKDGDRVEMTLPLPMRLEAIDNGIGGTGTKNPDTVALVRGPLVLFALTEDAPKVTREQLLAATRMKESQVWMAASATGPLLMTPFTEIHEERYRTYMTVTS